MRFLEGKLGLDKKLLLFFIWPFGSFLISLIEFRKKSSHVIFFLFFVLFGYTLIAEFKPADSYAYVQKFESISLDTSSDLKETLTSLYKRDSRSNDLYFYLTSYLVSRYTSNYHYLFALFAIVFSYFYIASFKLFVEDEKWITSTYTIALALVFALSNPIVNINGARFWTASWIYVFAMIQVFTRGNYKYLLLLFLCPLIHYSYIFFLILTLLFFVFKEQKSLVIIIYFISVILGSNILSIPTAITNILPEGLINQVEWYTSDYVIGERSPMAYLPTYAKLLNKATYYFVNILIIYIIIFEHKKINNQTDKQLLMVIIFLLSFVNFTISIPSVGVRFFYVILPLFVYLLMRLTTEGSFKVTRLALLLPLAAAYQYLYQLRLTIQLSDPYLYLSTLLHIIGRDTL